MLTLAQKRVARIAAEARMQAARQAAQAAVTAGKCPACGRKLRRNNSLAGWWQCVQFGSEQFRAEPSLPACHWQGFTE